jgi:hypothetical protein
MREVTLNYNSFIIQKRNIYNDTQLAEAEMSATMACIAEVSATMARIAADCNFLVYLYPIFIE